MDYSNSMNKGIELSSGDNNPDGYLQKITIDNQYTVLDIYTDGSCRLSNGGYGAVFLDYSKNKQFFSYACKNSISPVNYEEVSLKGHSQHDDTDLTTSISKIYTHHGHVPITPCTNQISELYAIRNSLYHVYTYISDSNYNKVLDLNITIYSDSKYAINCATVWIKNWKQNGWRTAKRKPVENIQLVQDIDLIISSLRKKDVVIQFKHVYGHSGDKYNELADRLAKMGRVKSLM